MASHQASSAAGSSSQDYTEEEVHDNTSTDDEEEFYEEEYDEVEELVEVEERQQHSDDHPSSSRDPEGELAGEVIKPQSEGEFMLSDDSVSSPERKSSQQSSYPSRESMASASLSIPEEQALSPSSHPQMAKETSVTTMRLASDELVKVEKATFPSSGFLFGVAILIILVAAGIVTGVSIVGRNKKVLDPLDVPTVSPAPTSLGNTLAPTIVQPTPSPTAVPTVATETMLDVFAQVVGDDVFVQGTVAQQAADWMLNQDPAQIPISIEVKSQSAWQQRYLLVYLYYATTENRQSEWLSCNPPVFVGSQTTDCEFASPTELPGGRLIFDPVPSSRWLSAAHECDWAGITCQTVDDDKTDTRLAVTSIMLGKYISIRRYKRLCGRSDASFLCVACCHAD
jgi:hypothetical protein